MRTIDDYLDQAIKSSGAENDSDLAIKVGVKRSSISAFRRKRAHPSDENMVSIARLAGLDEQVALIELSFWRAEGEAKNTYEKILKRISAFLPATLFGLAAVHPTTAHAAEIVRETATSLPHSGIAQSASGIAIIMYIMGNNRRFKSKPYVAYKRSYIMAWLYHPPKFR